MALIIQICLPVLVFRSSQKSKTSSTDAPQWGLLNISEGSLMKKGYLFCEQRGGRVQLSLRCSVKAEVDVNRMEIIIVLTNSPHFIPACVKLKEEQEYSLL
jgi:hypothetical protein